ncbi:hypothetical protein Lal_00026868, partial [Lupinus albus]
WYYYRHSRMTKEPTLIELESILENQEALYNQMSKVSINEEDKSLFRKKGAPRENKVPAKFSDMDEFSRRRQNRGGPQQWEPDNPCWIHKSIEALDDFDSRCKMGIVFDARCNTGIGRDAECDMGIGLDARV